jgi:hypothetical protein
MAKTVETALYAPVKAFLEHQGFEVKAEVQGCDVVAERGEDVLVVELKTAMSLALVLQGVNRLGMTDLVYLAIPMPKRAQMGRWSETVQLCRRLGLGLLVVHLRARGGARVEVATDPLPYRPRQSRVRRGRLLREFKGRRGDHNTGGASSADRRARPLVTSYREDAVQLAAALRDAGPSKCRDLRKATGCARASAILRANYYGWFDRLDGGLFELTTVGQDALVTYADLLVAAEATLDLPAEGTATGFLSEPEPAN